MIAIEGRVLAGLDEFMLRIGHLVLLCRVAHEAGGSWPRVQRELVERLECMVPVSASENASVAQYLFYKKLCPIRLEKEDISKYESEYRYPKLIVTAKNQKFSVADIGGDVVRVGWQDRNLSAPFIRSRVGAMTWTGRSGSKTGLSHIRDWAQYLDLIDSSDQVTPIGRLLIALSTSTAVSFDDWNPYELGSERLLIAHQYMRKDVDLFSHFAPRLLGSKDPLSKSVCRTLFVEALKECVELAESSRTISSRERFELSQQWRDLERSANKAGRQLEKISTAWHRTASRVELLTDIGFLDKGMHIEAEQYQYIYHSTSQLKVAAHTLSNAQNGDDWIDENLVDLILATEHPAGEIEVERDEIVQRIKEVVDVLKLPTTIYPIDCLCLGFAIFSARTGRYLSLKQTRKLIEELPQLAPDLARLSRGRKGTRAEFISLNLTELSNR